MPQSQGIAKLENNLDVECKCANMGVTQRAAVHCNAVQCTRLSNGYSKLQFQLGLMTCKLPVFKIKNLISPKLKQKVSQVQRKGKLN